MTYQSVKFPFVTFVQLIALGKRPWSDPSIQQLIASNKPQLQQSSNSKSSQQQRQSETADSADSNNASRGGLRLAPGTDASSGYLPSFGELMQPASLPNQFLQAVARHNAMNGMQRMNGLHNSPNTKSSSNANGSPMAIDQLRPGVIHPLLDEEGEENIMARIQALRVRDLSQAVAFARAVGKVCTVQAECT